MQHPYYPQPDKFIPDSNSISTWLKTRKNGSDNKPGIFETVNYKSDKNWSIGAILIEFLAFYMTIYGAYIRYLSNHNIGAIILSAIIVFLFIVFDIFGIMLHSHDFPEKVKNKSIYKVVNDSGEKKIIYNKLKEYTWREFFGILMLIISAGLKVFALVFFYRGNIQIIVIFTMLYFLVVYIHSVHSVYWLPALKLNLSLKKQYRIFNEYYQKNLPTSPKNTVSGPISINFVSSFPQEINEITTPDKRVLVKNVSKNSYEITCLGLLWDEDIAFLSSKWQQENNSDLLDACIKLQLLQLGTIV